MVEMKIKQDSKIIDTSLLCWIDSISSSLEQIWLRYIGRANGRFVEYIQCGSFSISLARRSGINGQP